MTKNINLRLLNRTIEEFAESYPGYENSEIFELFSAHCTLRSYSGDNTQLELGRIGQGTDGGIDWIYLVVNGEIVNLNEKIEDIQITRYSEISLIIGQSKMKSGWEAVVGNKFHSTFSDLFGNLGDPTVRKYSPDLISRVSTFSDFWMVAASKRPQFTIQVVYASKATAAPHSDVVSALELASNELRTHFKHAEVKTELMGADRLFELASSTPSYDADLEYQEELEKGNDKIALVRLSDYVSFLSDSNGNLNEHFFEGNVRHFEGNVNVNKQISETLGSKDSETDFWWLNNGVTMLVSEAPISRKKIYTLNDVQIVNGLQTSYSIFRWAQANRDAASKDNRCLLIRIIAPNSDEENSAIIRATNSQTPVEASSLRATDEIHRKIEDTLKLEGIYYDRRKNFHKNQGRKPRDIISIRLLSQATMSAFLGRPYTARARPSSFLQMEETYKKIFEERELEDFIWAAKTQKFVDLVLSEMQEYSTTQRNNLRFYVLYAMRILGSNFRKGKSEWSNVSCPNDWTPTSEQIKTSAKWIQNLAEKKSKDEGESLDATFKGSNLLSVLEEEWDSQSPFKSEVFAFSNGL